MHIEPVLYVRQSEALEDEVRVSEITKAWAILVYIVLLLRNDRTGIQKKGQLIEKHFLKER